MKYIGNVQSQANAEVFAVASGALPDGKPVIINSDGTVSVVDATSGGPSANTPAVFEAAATEEPVITFDSSSNKIVIAYGDGGNNYYGTAIVGTVSGTSITFGTPVVYKSAYGQYNAITFDSNGNKVVIAYRDTGNINRGKAIVGTVSGTNISFGSEARFETGATAWISATFDSNSNKVVIAYRDDGNYNYGTAIVGTVSGTDISYGSSVVFATGTTNYTSTTFDSNSNKVVIAYQYGTPGLAIVGTVSGTSISFGTAATFDSSASTNIKATFDSNSNKVVIAYTDGGSSSYGTAIVGTVSGTDISYGTGVVFENGGQVTVINASFDSTSNKVIIAYADPSDSGYFGTVRYGTVSGTSISFGSKVVFESANSNQISVTFDSNSNQAVVAYRDDGNSQHGTAVTISSQGTNLTTENFLGFTSGSLDSETRTLALGSATVFEAASLSSAITGSCFDSTNNRVVIVYTDGGNSNYGTAIVGQLDGTAITFGTPVVFESNSANGFDAAFDSNAGRVVIAYDAEGASGGKGTAIVGAVNSANSSISFGTAVAFTSGNISKAPRITFDSTNNKVVILYGDPDNSTNGTCIVGTVDNSDNSISFGTKAAFETGGTTDYYDITFSTAAGKVVIAYSEPSSSDGHAIVGTVSGTGISYGSETEFDGNAITDKTITYDSVNDRVVIAYRDSNSNIGEAIVGTVSGTDITFGSAVTLDSGVSTEFAAAFDPDAGKVVVVYRDNGNSDHGTYILGTVSGTSISFNTEAVFEAAATSDLSVVYCSTPSRLVIAYQDEGNSNYGTSIVLQNAATVFTRGETSSGATATVQVGGAISTLQTSLTAGQQYFVQTDGTIGTTAASPSVIAGTAVSATDLIVKG